jgi:hypothetical protein
MRSKLTNRQEIQHNLEIGTPYMNSKRDMRIFYAILFVFKDRPELNFSLIYTRGKKL